MAPVETRRATANSWQCDENDHINVQFYFANFDEAAFIFAHLEGTTAGHHQTRHLRYHAELRAGEGIWVESERLSDNAVFHRLYSAFDNRLSATALDTYGEVDPEIVPQEGRPRSLPTAPTAADTMADRLNQGLAVVGCRSVFWQADCRADGLICDQAFVARFSDSAQHFWAFSGFGLDYQREHGVGTVAVEMKLSIWDRPKAGDLLELITAPVAYGNRTITFRHSLKNMGTGRVAAMGDVTALLMDLTKRKSVALPMERLHIKPEKLLPLE